MTEQTYLSHSSEETLALGRALGHELKPDVAAPARIVLLQGELGAGKTCFIKGLAAALGIVPEEVTSPTFALVHAHPFQGGTLWHVDLYRLPAGAPIAEAIGLEDLLGQPGVVAIEWPERLGDELEALVGTPHLVWQVRIEEVDEGRRRVTIRRSTDLTSLCQGSLV
ncbi:MAG: tRNA (adenosine(37)-N6)-threonylcarbamoyltransferase complex ATPase subunit type 1 TsaE [Chloracidobacterium sp.]|nr:tRNA (adenosine(37)-N6)-threonylcarbamoyltransferase complex ATPase subunit type 1 TsaE [Chloracidobacterium sp.]MDW8218287.1 tRNA (adenosine(37)-N6)-threonylcarbamoyltransferase complex ATPase subunit type 1 TsaE [Acidobacteriota bacterium]